VRSNSSCPTTAGRDGPRLDAGPDGFAHNVETWKGCRACATPDRPTRQPSHAPARGGPVARERRLSRRQVEHHARLGEESGRCCGRWTICGRRCSSPRAGPLPQAEPPADRGRPLPRAGGIRALCGRGARPRLRFVVSAPLARTSYHAREAFDEPIADDGRLDQKIPGGKLLRIEVEVESGIVLRALVRGDFFAHPEELFETREPNCGASGGSALRGARSLFSRLPSSFSGRPVGHRARPGEDRP